MKLETSVILCSKGNTEQNSFCTIKKITHMKLITFITHWAVKIGFYERSCAWEPPCISVRNIKKRL